MATVVKRRARWLIRVDGHVAGDIIKRSFPCVGYRECDGALVSVDRYPDLFKAIGFEFGRSDQHKPHGGGPTHFRLPYLSTCPTEVKRPASVPDYLDAVDMAAKALIPSLEKAYGVSITQYANPPKENTMATPNNLPTSALLSGQRLQYEEQRVKLLRDRRELELAMLELDRQTEVVEREIGAIETLESVKLADV